MQHLFLIYYLDYRVIACFYSITPIFRVLIYVRVRARARANAAAPLERRKTMTEKQIELKLAEGVKALGGIAYKFVSPGNVGVPDRLVILPGGSVIFVELKTKVGKVSAVQQHQIARLRSRGAEVHVLWGRAGVDDFLQMLRRRKGGDAV